MPHEPTLAHTRIVFSWQSDELRLTQQLKSLYLSFLAEHYQPLANEAARQQWTAVQYLAQLIEGETQRRHERHIVRRIAAARFPVLKTLEQFNWTWPKKVNQAQVQNLFRPAFLKDKASVVFIGGVGLGKTHLATALGYAACLQGHNVLFTTAIEAINTLSAAQAQCRLGMTLSTVSTRGQPKCELRCLPNGPRLSSA